MSAAAESAAAESTATESAALSTTVLSATESVAAASEVLLPQEAKEIAAKATNMKTNFFIVCEINFLVKQSIVFLKRCKGTDFRIPSKLLRAFFGKKYFFFNKQITYLFALPSEGNKLSACFAPHLLFVSPFFLLLFSLFRESKGGVRGARQ